MNGICDVGSLTIDQFNYLADQTNDFAVNEKGEPVGEDGMMSAHPPSFVRNRLKDQQNQLLLESSNGDTSHLEKVLIETGTIAPGSHLQRQKRVSPSSLLRQHDLEQMYQELEMEMTSVLAALNAQQNGENGNEGMTDSNLVEMGKLGDGKNKEGNDEVGNGNENENGGANESGLQDSMQGVLPTESNENNANKESEKKGEEEEKEGGGEGKEEEANPIDPEVEDMFLSEEEQKKKRELWLASNGDWLKRQEEKRKEREQSGKKVTKRKKRTTVGVEGSDEG